MKTLKTITDNPAVPRPGFDAEENTGTVSVRVARTWEEVYSLRDIWQRFQWNPNADFDYYRTVLDCHPEFLRPHVLIVTRDDTPEAILVGRIENTQLEIKFGYKTLPGPRVRRLTLIHGGLLGNDSNGNCAILVDSLLKSLSEGEADLVWFNHLKMDSPLYRAAREVSGLVSRDWVLPTEQHWRMQLPRSFEELYQSRSSNTRHNLRRYTQRLLKKFGSELRIQNFQGKHQLEQLMSDTEAIAAQSYHRGLEAGFVNSQETRQLIALALDRGWFRAYVLYIRGKPCAFWNGLRYKNTFFTWTTAYVPEYRDFHLGTFLLQRMLEDLYREGEIEAVDFGFGDAQYKRDWADDGWLDASVCIFASTFRGALLNSLKMTSVALSVAAERVLTPKLLQRCKTMWRRWLTPKTVSTTRSVP
jgi:Acetyltransferase (GNAT) domain